MFMNKMSENEDEIVKINDYNAEVIEIYQTFTNKYSKLPTNTKLAI